MTNIWHSLTEKRPDPLRNVRKLSAEEQPRRCFIVVVWVLSIQTVLRRTTRGGRGGDAMTATSLLPKIGQM